MNFVAKILVVLQVVMSILFLAFAGAVYSVQTNWRERAGTLENESAAAMRKSGVLQQQLSDLETEKNEQLERQKGRADDFEAKNAALQRNLDQEKQRLDTSQAELNTQLALAEIAGEDAKEWRLQLLALRAENEKLHTAFDGLIVQTRSLKDEIFNKDRNSERLAAKQERLLKDLSALKRFVARKGSLTADVSVYEDTPDPPPAVDGVVLNTLKGKRSAPGLVEISVGSDDGLLKGHNLFVYRSQGKGKYLGRIRIVNVTPDRAVGTVVLPAKNGVIQRGDNVTTKL